MLKFKISKEDFEQLDESTQGLYEQKGEDYQLKVEGVPQGEDVSGLKNKISELMNETKAEREKRQALEKAQEEAEAERQKEKGEFKTLYEKTLSELEKERNDAVKFRQTIQQKEMESLARSIASKLTTDEKRAKILMQETLQFVKYGEDGAYIEKGGIPVEKDAIVAQLREDYPFLVGASVGKGGGASGSGGSGGATKPFAEMSGGELKALKDKDPATYERLRDEHYNK